MKFRILITGGAGFIGINSAAHFLKRGWKVTLLDNLSRKGTDLNLQWLAKEHPRGFSLVKADVRYDQDILAREVARHDAIIHLAAQVAVTTSIVDPRTDFEINTLGTFNMLESIRKTSHLPIFLYSSTNKVYGDLEELRIGEKKTRYVLKDFPKGVTEKQQLDFHSPYGCSKGAADKYVRDYARIYGIPTVVFRQSCIYGPNQFGVEDQGWLAWFVIATLLGKPITVYGNGKQVRDILHVSDLILLYERAIDKIRHVRGEAFNVGGGSENTYSLIEFFNSLENTHNLSVPRAKAAIRPGDQKVFVSNNAKITAAIGWRTKINLDEGIAGLISWAKDNLPKIKSMYSR
ncbi:MAG: GDP-mannose 4,6-dehydratase [Parcubacteria group bacterium]|nr:GDP-mannose 4,6-dehydratase [Parcubacteria group bacterium]